MHDKRWYAALFTMSHCDQYDNNNNGAKYDTDIFISASIIVGWYGGYKMARNVDSLNKNSFGHRTDYIFYF